MYPHHDRTLQAVARFKIKMQVSSWTCERSVLCHCSRPTRWAKPSVVKGHSVSFLVTRKAKMSLETQVVVDRRAESRLVVPPLACACDKCDARENVRTKSVIARFA